MSDPALPVPVTFYLPFTNDGIARLPDRMDDYWPWMSTHRRVGGGKYAWTLQTYLHLKDAGLPCAIAGRFPSRGVVISHRDFLPVFLRPRPGVFLICIKPDRKEHTWAHYYIVQNENDRLVRSRKGRNRTTVLPVWPQPSLVPRRADRGDRCCNVSYFGRRLNLARELKTEAWMQHLAQRGFNWSISSLETWNDYSSVDVTVSVRSFRFEIDSNPLTSADSKPPSKLINSWIAGVPAIVGCESAYRSMRQSPLDYLEAGSTGAITDALVELRSNRDLYRRMVAHGRVRARDFTPEALSRRWQQVLRTDISAAYQEWMRLGAVRRCCASVCGVVEYFANVDHWLDLRTISRWPRRR